MKAALTVSFAAGLLLVGCGERSTPPASVANTTNATVTETSPLNAPAGYLGALAKGQQSAVKTIDTTSVDKAIQLFSVENGRNPKDLNELVEQKFIPKIPETPFGTKLVYDPNAGTVKIVAQ
jgi:hypothetical protein